MKKIHIVFVAFFLASIVLPGMYQAWVDLRGGETPQALDLFLHTPDEPNLRRYERTMQNRSALAGSVRPYMHYLEFLALRNAGDKAVTGFDGWLFYRPGITYLIEPLPDAPSGVSGLDGAAQAILSFRDQLAAHGIALFVMPAPGKASVYPDMLTRRTSPGELPLSSHSMHLLALLKESGVRVVDLFTLYAGIRKAPAAGAEGLYLPRDTHWSPAGMEAAAREAASAILSAGLVAKGPIRYETRTVELRRTGDVVAMMDVPLLERHFAAEAIACRQVVSPGSGNAYKDSAGSDILVLGDSFLRIYERDEPGSAGFIAHLAKELGMPVASIVSDGGASTLVRQELSRRPELLRNKKIVLWEFVERDVRFGTEGWQHVPVRFPEAGMNKL